jgi:hypothetical protein
MSAVPARPARRRRAAVPIAAACALAGAAALPGTATATVSHPADLAITATSERGVYAPGETIRYTVVVTNAGEGHLARSRIAVSSAELPGLAPAGAGAHWLGPGERIGYTATRVATARDCGLVGITATVALYTGKEAVPDASSANDSATRWVEVAGGACAAPAGLVPTRPAPAPAPAGTREAMPQSTGAACPAPRLSARVAGPAAVTGGRTALFVVGVRNAGGAAARRTGVTLRLPAGFALARPVENALVAGAAMRWRIGTLPPGAGRTLAVRLRADRAAAGTRAVAASVSARCGAARATALVRVAPRRAAQAAPAVTG